ncbi:MULTISPECIES: di-trans,poly-cis-decaprenylcistransferase [unclassified Nitratiruptor]|uniref:di-trans,poly-cis-decaprenylcistransferase n=1 Tax=unclassified Nitratiruptor TaxID=2624044 RepID=UPI001915685C|nr:MULTISPECIES: di-trans,poly-cis-decaprenylcistransferase [unclassified Nitratiruptor]BCD60172.1 undecaprenyl diphosphate synthase [Nitratiruptor sp. YY08-10]BCD64340.1 undecaprenyl diphosphate synthase [Nitratiruptor sp. YY08-14]
MNRPRHIAIIMDGNGRWAQEKGLSRTKGHEKGAQVVRDITKFCTTHPEIEVLTLYAFSTENWKRPKQEVDFLMRLLDRWLQKELATYQENEIRFVVIGDISKFSKSLQQRIIKVQEATKSFTKLTQVLALNYGGRDEIIRACKRAAKDDCEIDEENFENYFDAKLGDVDMLIRTGGEKRISNFLLWRIAYAELFFTDTYWPDFTSQELAALIEQFKKRQRRFGGI